MQQGKKFAQQITGLQMVCKCDFAKIDHREQGERREMREMYFRDKEKISRLQK